MEFDQSEFAIRCEWGTGMAHFLPVSDLVIIVDVLSFSTAVDVATARGATVYPCPPDVDAAAYAAGLGAELARRRRGAGGYTLSPASLLAIPAGTRLVLPSPNGSALSFAAGRTPALCGCLRNAAAVARAAAAMAVRIAVIPAGERWPDGALRPALEDLVGAGAIIRHLPGTRSPEAEVAALAFAHYQDHLLAMLSQTGSGKELIGQGFAEDVRLAAMLDQSDNVPALSGRAYASRA